MTAAPTTLAFGAAGSSAGLVVPALAARNVAVRGFVRSADQAEGVRARGAAEVAIGDLTDLAAVARALEGIDSVFYIAPAFMPDEAEVGLRVVEACQAAGVRRFVFSSVIQPVLAALPNHAAKVPVEAAVLDSGMDYTFLHPALFFQNFAAGWSRVVGTGTIAEPWSAQTRFSRVDYRDVAEVAAIALAEDRLLHGTFELCAPGEHDRHDVAALISDVLGRKIDAATVDPRTLGDGAAPMRPMFDHYDHHGLLGSPVALRAILGREPRTLRDYFHELTATEKA